MADALLADLDPVLDGQVSAVAERREAAKQLLARALAEAIREANSGMRERAFRAARGVAYERTKSGADAEAKGAEAAADAIRALDVEPPEEAP